MVLGKVLALTAPPHALLQSTHHLMGSSGTTIILVRRTSAVRPISAPESTCHSNLRGGENENTVYRVGHSGCSPTHGQGITSPRRQIKCGKPSLPEVMREGRGFVSNSCPVRRP